MDVLANPKLFLSVCYHYGFTSNELTEMISVTETKEASV